MTFTEQVNGQTTVYLEQTAHITVGAGMSTECATERQATQRCCLSLLLYKIYDKNVTGKANRDSEISIRVGGLSINMIRLID